jgi:hypothetical protein
MYMQAPAYSAKEFERWSFLWTEVRLVVAAVALILGGVPPVYRLLPFPFLYGIVFPLLQLSWLLSGVAAGYLVYAWNAAGRKVFGGVLRKDVAAFWIAVVSGINLGLAGLIGKNIGMSLASGYVVFLVFAALYLASAYHLHARWVANGRKLF